MDFDNTPRKSGEDHCILLNGFFTFSHFCLYLLLTVFRWLESNWGCSIYIILKAFNTALILNANISTMVHTSQSSTVNRHNILFNKLTQIYGFMSATKRAMV